MKYEDEAFWRSLLASYNKFPDKMYMQCLPDPDTQPAIYRFAIASFLLWAQEKSFVSFYCGGGPLPYDPLLDIEMGDPMGNAQPIGEHVFGRVYEKGRVYLNISASVSEWIDIPPGLLYAETRLPVPDGPRLLGPREPLILLLA